MNITKIDAAAPEIKKLKVAAYCRVSTDNSDQLESLDAQKKHYESWIRKHFDWEYAGLYYDSGISGTKTAHRTGLQNMLADCKSGKIEYILTKSISRFARNTIDCLEIVRNLKNMNIFVYFEKENIDTGSMDSELILSVLSSLAADESVSISENEKWSVKKRFQNGTYKLPYMPYGYTKDENGNMIIQPEEAKIVGLIFEWAINGKSTCAIAKMLQEQNVPTKRGRGWSSTTVNDIISNEKYVGDSLFQKTYTDSSFRRHKNNGQVEKVLIKEHHEPIVSRDTFEKANALVQQRAKEKGMVKGIGVYHVRYSFSGRIICGECGSTFKRRKHINEIAWACTTHINDIQKCSMKYVRDDVLKASFTTMINKLIFGFKFILLPYLETLKNFKSSENTEIFRDIQEQLDKNNEKREVLRMLRSENVINSIIFNKEISVLNKHTEALKIEMSRLDFMNSSNSEIIFETEKLIDFIKNADMLNEYSDDLFSAFVNKIIIYDRNNIGFELKCGLILREMI